MEIIDRVGCFASEQESMALSDITAAAIDQAIAEFDRLDQDEFLSKYGFDDARDFFLIKDGNLRQPSGPDRLFFSCPLCRAVARAAPGVFGGLELGRHALACDLVLKSPGIRRMSVKDAYFWNAPC
jgi:hypothetical protein